MKRVSAFLCAAMMLCTFVGCSQVDTVPQAQTGDINKQNQTTVTTFPDEVWYTEENQTGVMDFAALDNLKKKQWTDIDGFDHIDIDDTHALFDVKFENYDKVATLYVTYDAATNVISEAVIGYGDVTVDALGTDSMQVARQIMVAMEAEKTATEVAQ